MLEVTLSALSRGAVLDNAKILGCVLVNIVDLHSQYLTQWEDLFLGYYAVLRLLLL